MVARIIHEHGVWCGTCREANEHNPHGYFEHVGIGRIIVESVGNCVNRAEVPRPPDGWVDDVERVIREDGYEGGPWLYKASAVYWRLMAPFRPYWIVLRRNASAILESCERSGAMRPTANNLEAHLGAMMTLQMRGAAVVNTDDLIHGDTSELAEALAQGAVDLDAEIVDRVVDPALWSAA